MSGDPAIGTLVAIGIGSNVGDRAAHVRRAITALGEAAWLTDVRASGLHETAAVRVEPGVDPGGAYINAAAVGRLAMAMTPAMVLARLLETERRLGRDRRTQSHGAARVIDLDLLMVGEVVVEMGEAGVRAGGVTDGAVDGRDVCLPHPGLGARVFVLGPLAELIPEVIVPVWGRSVRELRALAAARGQ